MSAHKTAAFTLLVLSATASAQFFGTGSTPPGGFTPANSPNVVQATTAAMTFYVDPTGNDSNACTSSGASACLTIQGAVNKVPKLLRHGVTVNVAAGSYAGVNVSGFTADNGTQTTSGGLAFIGVLTPSTLATGTATGTATSGTAGTGGSAYGTLVNSGATWTTNDLIGRIITTATPTNAGLVISSNTATSITVVGTWSAPTSSTTYTIQDSAAIITTPAARAATPTSAATAAGAAFIFGGNNLSYRAGTVQITDMAVTNATGSGILFGDNSMVNLTRVQVKPTGGTASAFLFVGPANVLVANSYLYLSTSISDGTQLAGGCTFASNRVLWRSGGSGRSALASFAPFVRLTTWTFTEVQGFTNGLLIQGGSTTNTNLSANKFTCASSAGVAMWLGNDTSNFGTAQGNRVEWGGVQAADTNITTCGTALRAAGSVTADVKNFNGSVATTGFDIRDGAVVTYSKADVTGLTAGVNEINMDSGQATALFADIASGSWLATPQGSRLVSR